MSNIGIAQTQLTGKSSGGSSSNFTFMGVWNSGTSYTTNNVVTRKGSAYVAVAGSTNQDPYLDTTSTFWSLLTQGFNFTGTWLNTTHYNYFDVVIYNKSFYLSVVPGEQTNTGNNPQTDAAGGVGPHWALLDQGFNFQGTWLVGTTYQQYDVVAYNSSSYVSLIFNNTGNTPSTSPSDWALLAQAGQVAPRQQFTFTMPNAPITNVQVTSNVVTLAVVNTFASQGEGTGQGQVNTIYLTGLTNATFLNGQVLTIATISPTQITANFTHANYPSTADSGTTTMSIPVGGVYWTSIPLGKTFALSYVQCAQANRIELYSTSTSRINDASRPATVQPTQFTQHGVILDLNLDGVQASFTSWVLSPEAYGANLDLAPFGDINILAALTNISGAATTNGFSITFTFTYEEQ
jgi:hypothetical protein